MSQVNLYMLQNDLEDFGHHILSKGDLEIYEGRFLDQVGLRSISEPSELILGTRYTLVVKALKHQYGPIKIDGTDKQVYEPFTSPSIEFPTPRFISGNEMIDGRIFAKIGWLKTKEHNKIFRSSYSRLERWLKKDYTKYYDHWWASSNAISWSQTNTGFVYLGGIGAKRIQLK